MTRGSRNWRLVNAPLVELVPAAVVAARAAPDARRLAHAEWLLRRKADGRYLASLHADGRLRPLSGQARRFQGGMLEALQRLRSDTAARPLSTAGVRDALAQLGVDAGYGQAHRLELVAEPGVLAWAGRDRYQRPLWLAPDCVPAWRRLRRAARDEGIVLEAISGYRSHAYQLGIFRRKLARGMRVEEILAVNAAPGYSEHHSGRALDLSTPGQPAAEESFEATAAFAWLCRHAAGFGFVMSYPRDNTHGIVYEPWHWCYRGPGPQPPRGTSAA